MSPTTQTAKRRAPRKRTAAPSKKTPGPVPAPAAQPVAVDLSTRFGQIADEAFALPGVDGAALLLTTAPDRLRVVAASGASPFPDHAVVNLTDGSLHWGGQTLAIAPADGDEDAGATDAVCVPLAHFGSGLGMLVVVGKKLVGKKRKNVASALEELGRASTPAAAAARVEMLDTHMIEVGAIVEVGQVLTGLLDMEDVLSYVVYLAESLVAGHNSTVALVAEDEAHLVLRNSTGSLRASEGRLVPIDASLMGWVVKNGEATTTPSLAEDPRGFDWEDRYGPAVVVPLTSNGRIIGTFMVTRVEGSPLFTEENTAVLRTMASYATISITNAEIHRHQQEVAVRLRAQATELEKAYGELSRSQEHLLVSEKMAALGRVTAGIAHEINSPLAGITNSLRTARAYVEEYRTSASDPEITAEDHQGIADDILNALSVADGAVGKISQFVKSIKGQTRVGDGKTREFDPAAEVDATVSLLQHELRLRRVAVYTEMDQGHKLVGDPGKFGLVIQNLISNALDAFEDVPGEIWVRITTDGDCLRLSVEDKGCGIPEEVRGRIFDYLFTTKDVGKGTGLGLAMVHSVVTSDFRGTIALESEPGSGTTFTLSFPMSSGDTANGS